MSLFFADAATDRVYASVVADGVRFYNMELDVEDPSDIWCDAENMWVSKLNSNNLFAYDFFNLGMRNAALDFEMNFATPGARAIWSNGRDWYVIDRAGQNIRLFPGGKEDRPDADWLYIPPEDSASRVRFTHPLFAADIGIELQLRAGRAEEESNWTNTIEHTIGGDIDAPGAPVLTFSPSFGGYVLTWPDPRDTVDDYDRTQVQELKPNGDPSVDDDWIHRTFTDGTSYVYSGNSAAQQSYMVRARHIDSSKQRRAVGHRTRH